EMNKGAGTLLTTIVAISLFANSNAPRQAPPRRAGAGADKQRAAPVVAEKSEAPRWTPPPPDPRCFLLKTISGFYGHGNSIPTGAYSNAEELKGCAPGERWGLSCDEASHIHFVIATVPDPVRTHLSLFFDRSIDAIQEAAQEEGWVFGAGGMPWDSGEHAESTDLDMRIAQQSYQKQRESLPGLMMFRRFRRPDLDLKHCKDSQQSQNPCGNIGDYDSSFNDNDVLFVFVVGETPTGGVRKGSVYPRAGDDARNTESTLGICAKETLCVGPDVLGIVLLPMGIAPASRSENARLAGGCPQRNGGELRHWQVVSRSSARARQLHSLSGKRSVRWLPFSTLRQDPAVQALTNR